MSSRAQRSGLACLAISLCAALVPALARADFGIESLSAAARNENKTLDVKAGSHPFEYTLSFTMNHDGEDAVEGTLSSLLVELPAGMVGDPLALPRCTRADFDFGLAFGAPGCPGDTQIGVADLDAEKGGLEVRAIPIYNLVPSPGSAGTLGTTLDNKNSLQEASLRSASDYGVNAADVTLPTDIEILRVTEHIWGVPMAPVHDPQRTCVEPLTHTAIEGCPSGAVPAAFLTLPTACSGQALPTTLRVASVEGGADSATVTSPALEGCEELPFAPTIGARPETAAADSPTGLLTTIHMPQQRAPGQLVPAHLRDTVFALPAGLALNPSAAIGRSACSQGQIALHEGTPPNCPDASKLGTVSVTSPLVDHPLPGAVYLARQGENPFGSLLALYLTVDDPVTGVVVKLAGKVEPDPLSGQLVASFKENPQAPIEDVQVHFFGGPRAALTTPPTCGTYTAAAQMTPWSAPQGKGAAPTDSFAITAAAQGGPCPASEAQMPNAPSFQAGTTAPLAGSFSPLVLKVSRENGSQRLGALNVTLPPGLVAKLAGVSECSEPQIAAAKARSNPGEGAAELASPSCPQSSELGTVTVGAGSGTPIYVQGHAYLAGPYKGAPLSLVIITPAVAGPFDLGVVVVRSALFIDESTAQATAKSDPIPLVLQGIPLAVRSVAVRLDRPQFTLNPTGCGQKQIDATAVSPIGASATMSAPFAVSGCRGLAFAPHFKLSLLGAKQMRRLGHPALHALLTYPKGSGYSNIAKASVTLPSDVFIDNEHINNPCKLGQFAAGACPPASVLGSARAYTPLLDKPLEGKVYFRANGGVRELPDVVADLNGQVHFVLVGATDAIVHGETSRIRNTFALVPDAPVTKFELNLFGGKRGLLENSANLCRTAPRATVKLTAQNGLTQNSNPPIATSCAKKKARPRHR